MLADITLRMLDDLKPDLWISLGFVAALSDIAVERIAVNVMDFPIPDNAGTQHGGNPVSEGWPAAHMATCRAGPSPATAQESGAGTGLELPLKIFLQPDDVHRVAARL